MAPGQPAAPGQPGAWPMMALISVFVGVTLLLATPSAFLIMKLSDKYALATSDAQQGQLLTAGEALLEAGCIKFGLRVATG